MEPTRKEEEGPPKKHMVSGPGRIHEEDGLQMETIGKDSTGHSTMDIGFGGLYPSRVDEL